MRGANAVKGVVVGAVVCTLVLGGAYGVMAATTQTASQYPSLVERIAKAFNLDPAKVDNVFQEERKARMADREATIEKRLDQLVTDKKITSAQKDAILKKRDEIQSKIESLRNETPAQRMTEMQKLRTELQAWAKENGLDTIKGIPGFGGPGRGHGGILGIGGFGRADGCASGDCGSRGVGGHKGSFGSSGGSLPEAGTTSGSATL
jgi:hypothetical protein